MVARSDLSVAGCRDTPGCAHRTAPTSPGRAGYVEMTPTQIAIAAVLRAWVAWPGSDAPENGRGEDFMRDVGDLFWQYGMTDARDAPTAKGLLLLQRDDERRASELEST